MVEFAYKAYKRTFAGEYQTASHELSRRPGILLRLRDGDGKVGFGEIAPIESFGTESFLAALSFVQNCKRILNTKRRLIV